MNRRWAIAALALALGACDAGAKQGPGAPGASGKGGRRLEFPVEVEKVQSKEVTYRVQAVGSIEAFEIVQVSARVPGAIEKVHFSEGDMVKQGALLVEIEPRRYQLQVESAKAMFAQAEAQAAEAQSALDRRTEANEKRPGLVKAEEIATASTKVQVAGAAVAEAQAALNLAELNLKDAVVRAPMEGSIETRAARTGQYVQPGALLATLVRRQPLLLKFQVPEQDAQKLTTDQVATFNLGGREEKHSAKIIQVAQAADAATRMVLVTARIDGAENRDLRPGAFAEVVVPIGEGSGAESPVIPQTAVRPSERGFLAFVVEDGVAKERVLQLGLRTESGLVEVRAGLKPGEQIVIRGAEALKDGVKVIVRGNEAERPAGGAPTGSGAHAGEAGASP